MLQSVSESRRVLGLGFMIATIICCHTEYNICQDPVDSAKGHTNYMLEFHASERLKGGYLGLGSAGIILGQEITFVHWPNVPSKVAEERVLGCSLPYSGPQMK